MAGPTSQVLGVAGRGAISNVGAASPLLGRIASAPASPLQAEALTQAQTIIGDCGRNESQVSSIGKSRRQQVTTFFSGARQGLTAVFTGSVVSVQTFIASKQAEIISAATSAHTLIRSVAVSTLQAGQTLAGRIRKRVNDKLESISTTVQTKVEGVATKITGLIDSIPFPNIPGIAQIRNSAVNLLNRAAGVVTGAVGRLTGFIGRMFKAGMNALDFLFNFVTSFVDMALSLASAAITGVIRTIGNALNSAVAFIGSVLQRTLRAIVIPILRAIESLINRLISTAEQGALALLRRNRNEYLSSLAEGLTPRAAATGAKAASMASQRAVMRQIARDAAQNGRRIVQTFEFVTGGAITTVLRLLASARALIVGAITAVIAPVIRLIVTAVTQVVQMISQFVAGVVAFLVDLFSSLTEAAGNLYESVRSLVQGEADRLVQFAENGLRRIGNFVRSFVQNLILGRSVSSSLTEAMGLYSPAPTSGPIIIPRPGPITIPVLLTGLFAVLIAIGGLIVYAVPALAVVVTFLTLLGLSEAVALAVIAIVALLLLLLLRLLLWLLWRWLTRRRLPPGKRVIRVTPSVLELGVGGRTINSRATIAPGTPPRPPLTWSILPAAPAGVSILGSGQRVGVRAVHPPHGTVVGGRTITVRAALTTNPADFADSAAVMIVQVLTANYVAAPPLANVPSLIPGVAPLNTAEPNRDGISGNTAVVNATTAPAARPIAVAFRRSLGASVAGSTITPARATGDVGLRISDNATRARLDETQPSTAGPAALMADMTVNAVPTRVRSLTGAGTLGSYSVRNTFAFTSSDGLHPPLDRVVGELITFRQDQLNLGPPNGGYNPIFRFDLAVPANTWTDQLVRPSGMTHVTDGMIAIDVNRFTGPGVPSLPQRHTVRQRFVYSAWQGAGTVISRVFDDGFQRFSLVGQGPNGFTIEHIFPGARAPIHREAYVGPPLIVLSNVTATPTALGATALAADGAATASLGVTSNVAGRTVNWTVLGGDIVITGGNPAVLPATATLRAGVRTGNFGVRAADTIFTNRRVRGRVGVVAVALRNIRATPNPVPSGTLSATVSLNAEPGGRTINWSVDPAAAAAGVTVTPNVTGPGAAPMSVTVTRPAGFTGSVVVTATDSVVAARTNRVRIIFR